MVPNSTPFPKIGNTSNMHHMPFIIVWFFNFHCSCTLIIFSYFHFLYFSIVHWKRSIRCSKWVTFGCFRGLPRHSSFDIFTYPKISILFKYSYFTSISDNFFPTNKKKEASLCSYKIILNLFFLFCLKFWRFLYSGPQYLFVYRNVHYPTLPFGR